MRGQCWAAEHLPDAGPCSGRLQFAHLISQQFIRREVGRGWRRVAADRRSGVLLCSGPGGHHGRLDHSRTLRIPFELLPPLLVEFAAEYGWEWKLLREYPRGGSSSMERNGSLS